MTAKLHFRRFEFKYLLTAEQEFEIKRHIRRYVAADAFAAPYGGAYKVYSLYYDSPRYYYYWQKMDGVNRRKKIRLRTYRYDGKFYPYAFLEIKRKVDAIILKDRMLIDRTECERLVTESDMSGSKFFTDGNGEVYAEFESERMTRSISPKILVVYDREPYLGKYNLHFRVTFDKNIRAAQNDNLFYDGNDLEDVSDNYTVMELKYNGTLPFYMNQVIKEFNLDRVAFSKYAGAVDACGAVSARAFPFAYKKEQIESANMDLYSYIF